MNLTAQYELAIAQEQIQDDPMQRLILKQFQRVADALQQTTSWFKRWSPPAIQGIYLHGPVGVGKTYLVDMFYYHVEEPRKSRFHFHHFMQQVDAKLRLYQGQKDPLRKIAKDIGKTTRLLCFDEFLVHDVAVAMILAELLIALLAEGIVLIVAANTAPDDLYANGVQRPRFLPAIALIKKHCEVIGLREHADYRLGRTPSLQAYFFPLNAANTQAMTAQFNAMTMHAVEHAVLNIQNRLIPCVQCSDNAVWFRFDVICNFPRSQLDYLELADRFDTFFISEIPQLSAQDTVAAILLIHLIDVFYDRGIHLILSAAVKADELYVEGEMVSTFQRTLSRLQEMQSQDYLTRHARRKLEAL